ncbi:MAG: hypothetical protein J6J24_04345 [Clostridia bacterium]|nr:hypothetical protein [Clostridia bacterium]
MPELKQNINLKEKSVDKEIYFWIFDSNFGNNLTVRGGGVFAVLFLTQTELMQIVK